MQCIVLHENLEFLPYPESEICEDPELERECDYNIQRSQDYKIRQNVSKEFLKFWEFLENSQRKFSRILRENSREFSEEIPKNSQRKFSRILREKSREFPEKIPENSQ